MSPTSCVPYISYKRVRVFGHQTLIIGSPALEKRREASGERKSDRTLRLCAWMEETCWKVAKDHATISPSCVPAYMRSCVGLTARVNTVLPCRRLWTSSGTRFGGASSSRDGWRTGDVGDDIASSDGMAVGATRRPADSQYGSSLEIAVYGGMVLGTNGAGCRVDSRASVFVLRPSGFKGMRGR